VAADVQDFYERYPYPRPIVDLKQYGRLWQSPDRRRADYHLFWPARPYRDDYCILIAGCGTSQAAKHALRWPAARVVGIDFSATSVRHTEQLVAEIAQDWDGDSARAFVERLWWHDHVVFDTSTASCAS